MLKYVKYMYIYICVIDNCKPGFDTSTVRDPKVLRWYQNLEYEHYYFYILTWILTFGSFSVNLCKIMAYSYLCMYIHNFRVTYSKESKFLQKPQQLPWFTKIIFCQVLSYLIGINQMNYKLGKLLPILCYSFQCTVIVKQYLKSVYLSLIFKKFFPQV